MKISKTLFLAAWLILLTIIVEAQTTAFNFQGRLNDGGNAANGNYDLQFKLFDALAGGNQVGSTVSQPNLQVINGVFSVVLDFGAAAFTGGNRFLEISVRPFNSPNAHVVLGARQQILAVPFAVRSSNATNAENAVNAQTAVNATNAQNSINATTAQNALNLGGAAASNYARLNATNTGGFEITGDLTVRGNISQWNASYGGIKAMIYAKPNFNSDPTIVRCYNAITNSSVPPCGFSIIRPLTLSGVYKVDFGFGVIDRIVSVSAEYASGCNIVQGTCGAYGYNYGANFRRFNTTIVDVFTFPAGESDDTTDAAFTIILY